MQGIREAGALSRFGRLFGFSPAMRSCIGLLERAAPSTATVLLSGETGTGKELAAEALHGASARRDSPFVIVDCGAAAGSLLESELFGHERGAFTGADRARMGAFELADKGTLFLDEIGELSAELQPKLLRALERKMVKRVGGNRWLPLDVRVIAATHRSLVDECAGRRFREDLYYRLAVVEIRIPPLRERAEDVAHLVDDIGREMGLELDTATTHAMSAALMARSWPGNVRELRNHLERLRVTGASPPEASTQTSTTQNYLERLRVTGATSDHNAKATSTDFRSASEAFARTYFVNLIARHPRIVDAARAAGVGRQQLYRLLARHGVQRREV